MQMIASRDSYFALYPQPIAQSPGNYRFPIPLGTEMQSPDIDLICSTRQELHELKQKNANTEPLSEPISDKIKSMLAQVEDARSYYSSCASEYLEAANVLENLSNVEADIKHKIHGYRQLLTTLKDNNSFGFDTELLDKFINDTEASLIYFNDKITETRDQLDKNKNNASTMLQHLSPLFSTVQSCSHYRACSICLTREVDAFLIPCGHTFCKHCLQQATKVCFICRRPFINASPLFML
jgi:hypothetical protein